MVVSQRRGKAKGGLQAGKPANSATESAGDVAGVPLKKKVLKKTNNKTKRKAAAKAAGKAAGKAGSATKAGSDKTSQADGVKQPSRKSNIRPGKPKRKRRWFHHWEPRPAEGSYVTVRLSGYRGRVTERHYGPAGARFMAQLAGRRLELRFYQATGGPRVALMGLGRVVLGDMPWEAFLKLVEAAMGPPAEAPGSPQPA